MWIGDFELHNEIRRGGTGRVWAGVHRPTKTPVALKLLSGGWASNPDLKASFREEVRAVASLDHPHIVRVLDFGEVTLAEAKRTLFSPGAPYLAMERIDGGTLAQSGKEPLPWTALQPVLVGLLDALAHAHARGVIHRDLKGGNVLLSPRGPILTDFGIAHLAGRVREAATVHGKAVAGTPSFMAPEQFRGDWRRFGPGTDLYALGALFWWLVTGRRPFETSNWDEAAFAHAAMSLPAFDPRVTVPPGLEDWLRTCLAKDPQDRFAFAADAMDGLVHLPRTTRPVPPMPSKWGRGRDPVLESPVGLGLYGLRAVPFVARKEARDTLWSALSRVRTEGRPQVVVVHGSAGSGKSHLARWFCERAHEVGAATSMTAMHSRHPTRWDGLAPMLARCLRITKEVGVRRSRLVERECRALGCEESWEWKLLDRFLDPRAEGISPIQQSTLLQGLLRRMARSRPLIVWVDDAQWGRGSLSLVADVMRAAVPIPVVFVLTVQDEALAHRPVEQELLAKIEGARRDIPLGALNGKEVGQLLGGLLRLDPAVMHRIVAQANGSPLFAVQLLDELVQRDDLVPTAWGYTFRAHTADLPTSLRVLWGQRVSRALQTRPVEDRRALQIAALLGREVQREEWTRALAHAGLPDGTGLAEELIERRLARAHPEGVRVGFAFVHGLLREALVAGISDDAATSLHQAVAHAILDVGAENLARRGTHLHHAGDHEAAISVLLRGLEAAVAADQWESLTPMITMAERSLHAVGAAAADARFGALMGHQAELANFRERPLQSG